MYIEGVLRMEPGALKTSNRPVLEAALGVGCVLGVAFPSPKVSSFSGAAGACPSSALPDSLSHPPQCPFLDVCQTLSPTQYTACFSKTGFCSAAEVA